MNHTSALARAPRVAAAALLIPTVLIFVQGCDAQSTAATDPCPASGVWTSSAAGRQADPNCAWDGVITLSHTLSIESSARYSDYTGAETEEVHQDQFEREIKVTISGGRAHATVAGTWTGRMKQTVRDDCTTVVNDADHTVAITGGGEVPVTLTLQPDGNYRLDFAGPEEVHDQNSRFLYTHTDRCGEPKTETKDLSGTNRADFPPLPFTVHGKVEPGSNRIAGTKEVPLPLITPIDDPEDGVTGTQATVYTVIWTLERKG